MYHLYFYHLYKVHERIFYYLHFFLTLSLFPRHAFFIEKRHLDNQSVFLISIKNLLGELKQNNAGASLERESVIDVLLTMLPGRLGVLNEQGAGQDVFAGRGFDSRQLRPLF